MTVTVSEFALDFWEHTNLIRRIVFPETRGTDRRLLDRQVHVRTEPVGGPFQCKSLSGNDLIG